MVSPSQRRRMLTWARGAYGVSDRRTCEGHSRVVLKLMHRYAVIDYCHTATSLLLNFDVVVSDASAGARDAQGIRRFPFQRDATAGCCKNNGVCPELS